MGSPQTEAVELSTLVKNHTDFEELVKKLNDIKSEYLSLQNLIKQNIRLQAEHHDLLQDRANEISNYYSYQVMTKFSYLHLSYEDLKRKLTHYLSAEEIKDIEDSVIHASRDEDAFANLLFFPEFQAEHETAISQHAQVLHQAKHFNNQDIWIDNVNYAERAKSYRTWYVYTGLLSI